MLANNRRRRTTIAGALVMTGALVLAGCSDQSEGDATGNGQDMVLDLESGQAETEFGTVEAQRADHSYVTALGEGQAIGVTTPGDVGVTPDGSGGSDGEHVVVYVYDREELAVLTGPVDEAGGATLASTG